jgi:glycosyltransferase involved in cell wall biosynthesis
VDLPEQADWPELDLLLSDGRPLVISVGRLEWIKGMETLIRALPLLSEDLRPYIVFIGADHGAGASLRKLADDIGVSQMCHFMGPQPRGRVLHAYRSAQACVISSHTEAFPAVPLEAMLAGTAVVTTRLPGLAGYAVEGVNCEMFTPGDETELSVKLGRVLSDDALRESLVRAGLVAAARFNWPGIARDYERLLARIVGGIEPA